MLNSQYSEKQTFLMRLRSDRDFGSLLFRVSVSIKKRERGQFASTFLITFCPIHLSHTRSIFSEWIPFSQSAPAGDPLIFEPTALSSFGP